MTVTTTGLAPDTLVGHKLELINNERGGPLMSHDASVTALTVATEVNLYFWDTDDARNPAIRVEASDWTYERRGNKGTVRVVFPRDILTDFITTCMLTFEDRYSGTHRCEFEDKATRTIDGDTVGFGWGEGTFELDGL